MLAARQTNISARIYQIHGLRYETAAGTKRRLLMGCERWAANCAHKVICVSPSVRERAVEDGILSKEKAFVLASGSAQGIDLTKFNPALFENEARSLRKSLGIPPEAGCVLYMGRIAADKGLSDLAAAWLSITESHANAHLIVAGNVDPTDPFEVAILGTLPHVHLLPHQDDPRPLLALADVVTLPSYREGLPQTILEAGAMKKPVVGTHVTGVVDALLEGKSGLLVPPHDPQGLAHALLVLLVDAEHRRRMGEVGRENVGQRFRFEPIVRETLALYESVLLRKARR
jgi:glycosyltransferase involved in cell wall biosynthesis